MEVHGALGDDGLVRGDGGRDGCVNQELVDQDRRAAGGPERQALHHLHAILTHVRDDGMGGAAVRVHQQQVRRERVLRAAFGKTPARERIDGRFRRVAAPRAGWAEVLRALGHDRLVRVDLGREGGHPKGDLPCRRIACRRARHQRALVGVRIARRNGGPQQPRGRGALHSPLELLRWWRAQRQEKSSLALGREEETRKRAAPVGAVDVETAHS